MDNQSQISEIFQYTNRAKPFIRQFKSDIENKEVVVCLGNTRSGKSTFINYEQRNTLMAFKNEKSFFIKKKNPFQNGPTISHGSLSCTEYPTVWERNNQNVYIIDVPGFEDNRGVAQDFVNTLFFNQLRYAKTVKFVLIVDINDIICDNIQSFIGLLRKMETLIHNPNELYSSISLIYTKDYKNLTIDEIVELLRKKVLIPAINLKKDLIYEIIRNKNRIGILRYPSQEGDISNELDCNIECAIDSSFPVINTTQIKFLPSENTCKVLFEIYNEMLFKVNFSTELEKAVTRFENYFSIDKYVFASTEEELDYTKTSLLYILTKITTEKVRSLPTINELRMSLTSISSNLSQDFERSLRFMKHVDDCCLLDEVVKENLKTNYYKALTNLENDITKLIAKIDAEVKDRTEETMQYIISQLNTDRNKVIVTATALMPLVKKGLEAFGMPLPPGLKIDIMQISASGCAFFSAAAIGVVAGSYAIHYYNTIWLRCSYRKEQRR